LSFLRHTITPLQLSLRDPFAIAHGTSLVRDNLLVTVQWGFLTGYGEVAVVPYRGDTAADLERELSHPGLLSHLSGTAPLDPERALQSLRRPLAPAALAGLDMALYDLWARRQGRPLFRIWGLDPARCPHTSFTIAMDSDLARYRERVRAASGFALLKLKLGCGDLEGDLELANMAHEQAPHSRLCVDANGAWTPDQAARAVTKLRPLDLLFLEQPVPAELGPDGWRELRGALSGTAPPLVADESFQCTEDLAWLADAADGVNIKLSKLGGLAPAHQAIHAARAAGLMVLLGCMVESSLGVTAAAHLAPLCDLADLDGHLLLEQDPFMGLEVSGAGEVSLPELPGLGVNSGSF
jgi:L-Ala-D/L-Glu epimerase